MNRASGPDGVVLAIDLGTGGPKVALVSLAGEVLGAQHRRVTTTVVDGGGATQDPSDWWHAITDAAAALADDRVVDPGRVVAVACTGQWGSTVPVDADGQPAGDCLLWFDRRGRRWSQRATGGPLAVAGYGPRKAATWISRSGGAPSAGGNDPLGHRLWISHEAPDVDRRTATFMEPVDYLNLRLTGRVAATQVSMLAWWLTDNRRMPQVRYDPRLLALAQVGSERLPPLVPIDAVVGGLLAPVAAELGVPPGIPVVTALPDLHATALGSGAVGESDAHLSISTSAWVGCHAPTKRTSLRHQMATVPSALAGRYLLANNHETAGACLEWLRDQVVLGADGLTTGDATLADFDAVAATARAGSGGVLFAPWLNGERSPVADTNLRASFHNVSLATTRADLVRAVLEGVAHNARWLYEASESVVGRPLGGPRLVGGGAVSDLWAQIHADVLGRPVHRVRDPLYTAVRGAGLFAGITLRHLVPADLARLVSIDTTFAPDPDTRAVHDAHHREFRRLARQGRGMYRRLNGDRR
jgi:xylulokinase